MNKVLAATSLLLILLRLCSSVLINITCGTSDIGTCENPYCSISPTNEASYGCVQLTRQLNNVKITQTISIEIAGIYVLLNSSTYEYCQYDIEEDKGSVFNIMYSSIEAANPGFVHQCPYQGPDFHVKNLKFDAVEEALVRLSPDLTIAAYTITYVASDDLDENIFSRTFYGELHFGNEWIRDFIEMK